MTDIKIDPVPLKRIVTLVLPSRECQSRRERGEIGHGAKVRVFRLRRGGKKSFAGER